MEVSPQMVEALVMGGAFLGGGGGGSHEQGSRLGRLALELGSPKLLTLEEMDPTSWVATVSMVGAPASEESFLEPMDHVRALGKLAESLDAPLAGIITNEMGGLASVNGLLQSAVLGLPVIDAPCNGRAHPIAAMGSMGLHQMERYVSVQAACGGRRSQGRRVEMVVKGGLDTCSTLVRQAAVQAGGLVAVARNPVQCQWLEEHCAVGAMDMAGKLGNILLKEAPVEQKVAEVVDFMGGTLLNCAKVKNKELVTKGGFDLGRLTLDSGHELLFWNEYMLVEQDGKVPFSFPDLIATVDAHTGVPVSSADIRLGQEVILVGVPAGSLLLGAGARDTELWRRAEEAIGRPLGVDAAGDANAA